jgi:hypothetical protein
MPIPFCVQDCSAAYQQYYDRKRPNILLVMTDQQRYDTIRYVQDQMSRYDSALKINTPNLDTLLESGAYFETAYIQWYVSNHRKRQLIEYVYKSLLGNAKINFSSHPLLFLFLLLSSTLTW